MKIWTETSLLVFITAIAAITDIKFRRVFNAHLVVMLLAIFLRVSVPVNSGGISLYGFILPFVIHYIPFKLRLVSAGDVKLFMVIGLLSGVEFIAVSMMISYLIGGVVALAMMIHKKCLLSKMRLLYLYFMSLLIAKELIAYKSVERERLALPFALMIHLSIMIQVFYLG